MIDESFIITNYNHLFIAHHWWLGFAIIMNNAKKNSLASPDWIYPFVNFVYEGHRKSRNIIIFLYPFPYSTLCLIIIRKITRIINPRTIKLLWWLCIIISWNHLMWAHQQIKSACCCCVQQLIRILYNQPVSRKRRPFITIISQLLNYILQLYGMPLSCQTLYHLQQQWNLSVIVRSGDNHTPINR